MQLMSVIYSQHKKQTPIYTSLVTGKHLSWEFAIP